MARFVPLDSVKTFLIRRGWSLYKQTDRFDKYELGGIVGDDPVYLTLPLTDSNDSDVAVLNKAIDFISDFYEYSVDVLFHSITKNAVVFSSRLIDESTKDGDIPFLNYENHLIEIKNLLIKNASFSVNKRHYTNEIPEEANVYLKSCKFLQTSVGSFVSKVELPSASNLSVNLFDEYATQADGVNELLGNVLDFVVNGVYKASEEDIFSVEHINNNSNYININLLETVNSLFRKTDVKEINFNILGSNIDYSIESGPVGNEEFRQLDRYIEFAEAIFSNQFDIEGYGKITQLRSSNTSGNSNLVVISRTQRGQKPLHVLLDSTQYALAITAHKAGNAVYIKGVGSETKKYIKILRLADFRLR